MRNVLRQGGFERRRWVFFPHRENNSRYAEVLRSCSGTDKYVSVSVQKLKGPAKNKPAQTEGVGFVDSGDSSLFFTIFRLLAVVYPLRPPGVTASIEQHKKMLHFC